MYTIVYTNKCTDCGYHYKNDYMSPDGKTCLDCMTEEQWARYEQARDEGTLDLYRDSDTMIEEGE